MRLGVAVDLSRVNRAFDDTFERARRLRPGFAELRRPMRADQREHARAEQGPDSGWPPRAAVTEERRRATNRRLRTPRAARTVALAPLRRRRQTPKRILGRLPAALKILVDDTSIIARSRVLWSGAHQEGDRVGRGRRVRLPARTFLWLSDKLIELAAQVLIRRIAEGLE